MAFMGVALLGAGCYQRSPQPVELTDLLSPMPRVKGIEINHSEQSAWAAPLGYLR